MAIDIKRKEDCCGCSACISSCGHQAITLSPDSEGFLYPEVDHSKCVECGLCEAACPIIERRKGIPEPDYKGLFAGRIKDDALLKSSSSGGIFSALALSVINAGGKVVGAVYDENMTVKHAIASTPGELARMRGSKYSQSDMRGIFKEIRRMLVKGERVMFSGTPCQVEGLKLFLRKPYPNLLTVDIVCHAVPSPKIFKEYTEMVTRRLGSRLVDLKMRDKESHGWAKKYSYRYILADGRQIIDTDKVSDWSRIYFSKLINRPSCQDCLFTNYSRPGDITIADFWDEANRRPELKYPKGTSLIIANTAKGEEMLNSISSDISIAEITKEESYQPCLIEPTKPDSRRAEFWEYYYSHGFDKTYKKYFNDSLMVKLKKGIKNLLRPIAKPLLNKIMKK